MPSPSEPTSGPFAGAAIPSPLLPDDDGSASAELRKGLADVAAGEVTGAAVLQAMAGARLLVPVVAVLETTSDDAPGVEKDSSMAVALLDSPSHGRALLAFSGMDALSAWSAEARPVSLAGPLSARAAVSERADALLVDVAGPAPFAVTGYELLLLASLARGQGPLARDPVLQRAISTVLPESWSFKLHASGEDAPARLVIQDVQQVKGAHDTAGEQQRRDAVEALARDRVVAQLLPHGLHVSFHDL